MFIKGLVCARGIKSIKSRGGDNPRLHMCKIADLGREMRVYHKRPDLGSFTEEIIGLR